VIARRNHAARIYTGLYVENTLVSALMDFRAFLLNTSRPVDGLCDKQDLEDRSDLCAITTHYPPSSGRKKYPVVSSRVSSL